MVHKLCFLIIKATLEVVVLSFQESRPVVVIPQLSQFFVISLVDLTCEKLYLFGGAVHLFPVILLGEQAVTLLSDDCSSSLFSSGLVASSQQQCGVPAREPTEDQQAETASRVNFKQTLVCRLSLMPLNCEVSFSYSAIRASSFWVDASAAC
jgi:hypothetical protein